MFLTAPVWALNEDLSDERSTVEHHGKAEGGGILVELAVHPECRVEQDGVLWLWDVLHTAGEKETICSHHTHTQ